MKYMRASHVSDDPNVHSNASSQLRERLHISTLKLDDHTRHSSETPGRLTLFVFCCCTM
jgi:hypothetical protein